MCVYTYLSIYLSIHLYIYIYIHTHTPRYFREKFPRIVLEMYLWAMDTGLARSETAFQPYFLPL